MASPFAWIRGRLFVVANWDFDMPDDCWLVLRPATEHELDQYLERLDQAETEAWYTMVLRDRHRFRGRRGPPRHE